MGEQLRGVLLGAAITCAAVLLMPAIAQAQGALQPEVRTVAAVDLERYLGDWYEVARLPNWFQRKCLGDVVATYARRSDGRLDVINRCRTEKEVITARGVARVLDSTGTKLKVRFAPAALSFLPFVWGDYWVLGLADDYSWAVVGSPDRKYLWVLSRTPTLPDDVYAHAIESARTNGFELERVQRTENATHSTRTP